MKFRYLLISNISQFLMLHYVTYSGTKYALIVEASMNRMVQVLIT